MAEPVKGIEVCELKVCSNLDCNTVITDKGAKRCSMCRWSKRYVCATCGTELRQIKKTYCEDCREKRRLKQMIMSRTNIINKECRRIAHKELNLQVVQEIL